MSQCGADALLPCQHPFACCSVNDMLTAQALYLCAQVWQFTLENVNLKISGASGPHPNPPEVRVHTD